MLNFHFEIKKKKRPQALNNNVVSIYCRNELVAEHSDDSRTLAQQDQCLFPG